MTRLELLDKDRAAKKKVKEFCTYFDFFYLFLKKVMLPLLAHFAFVLPNSKVH